MRRNRIVVPLFMMGLILLIIGIFYVEINDEDNTGLYFSIQSDGVVERINYWEDDNGKIYVFLPGYAKMCDLNVNVGRESQFYIDNVKMESGTSCSLFEQNKEYNITGIIHGETVSNNLEFVQLGSIPTIYIDTQSGNMEYIHKEKGNEESGSICLYRENGKIDYKGELESIKGRGNVTWETSKKPYNIRLSKDGSLLGMGDACNWILLANAFDHTSLKNKMIFDFAKRMGMEYVPDCQWVDLFLNGDYVGLYLLSERIEIHSERVNISSNGFLVSGEPELRLLAQNLPYIRTEKGMALRIHGSGIGNREMEEIWQSVENAILNENGIDHISGAHWQELIDLESWVKRFLLDEIFLNFDGGFVSQFYYYDQNNSLLYAGPVWDMDLCLAQTGWPGGYTNAILTYRDHLNWSETSLYGRLYQIPEFRDRLIQLYKTVFLPAISELLEEKFMHSAEWISQAAWINSIRWNTNNFQDEIEENYLFLKERVAFLNEYWLQEDHYYKVHIEPGFYGVWGCVAVKSGEQIPMVYGDSTDGWYILDTEEPFDIKQPIYEDVSIYHRDSVNAVQQKAEEENMDTGIVSDSGESLKLQRVAPIVVLSVFLVSVAVYDLICRKKERKSRHAKV